MTTNIILRNNVKIKGNGDTTILLAPGFGCDQTVWNNLASILEKNYRIILFDYVGMGDSDISAYNKEKYSKLEGYAEDVLDVCAALQLKNAVFIGHSVGGMIGMLASFEHPEYFSELIMLGPSPCYLNDPPEYYGGFEREDLVGLIDMIDKNYIGWANFFASTITNNPERPDVTKELEDRFCSTDPIIARNFAEACFFADNRKDLSKVTVPSLILQCSNDVIAPTVVGDFMVQQMPNSTIKYMDAIGHCPHMSDPEETFKLIEEYLSSNHRLQNSGREI